MKSPRYLTIGDLVSIISLILISKVLLIVLEGCLCINRKVDFEKFKDSLFFLNQKSIFFNSILFDFAMTLNSSRTSLNMYHQRTRLYSFEKQLVNRLYIKEIIMDLDRILVVLHN